MVVVGTGDGRLPVDPRAQKLGQRFILTGQCSGLPMGDGRLRRETMAAQTSVGEVERRSLEVYELAAAGGAR